MFSSYGILRILSPKSTPLFYVPSSSTIRSETRNGVDTKKWAESARFLVTNSSNEVGALDKPNKLPSSELSHVYAWATIIAQIASTGMPRRAQRRTAASKAFSSYCAELIGRCTLLNRVASFWSMSRNHISINALSVWNVSSIPFLLPRSHKTVNSWS